MKKFLIFICLIALTLIIASPALAGVISDSVKSFGDSVYGSAPADSLPVTATKIINGLFGILGLISVGVIIYAGFLYMTSQGKEDVIKKAKGMLITAVIGLVIIFSAYAIANFVTSMIVNSAGGGGAGGGGNNPPVDTCTTPPCQGDIDDTTIIQ